MMNLLVSLKEKNHIIYVQGHQLQDMTKKLLSVFKRHMASNFESDIVIFNFNFTETEMMILSIVNFLLKFQGTSISEEKIDVVYEEKMILYEMSKADFDLYKEIYNNLCSND
ncbi:hypothetical protein COBT_002685 [Conglomerata obtusa]